MGAVKSCVFQSGESSFKSVNERDKRNPKQERPCFCMKMEERGFESVILVIFRTWILSSVYTQQMGVLVLQSQGLSFASSSVNKI